MKVHKRRKLSKHKDIARHEVFLPGASLTAQFPEVINNLHCICELLALTEKTIKQRIQRYKCQPRTIFVSGRTATDAQIPTHTQPKSQKNKRGLPRNRPTYNTLRDVAITNRSNLQHHAYHLSRNFLHLQQRASNNNTS